MRPPYARLALFISLFVTVTSNQLWPSAFETWKANDQAAAEASKVAHFAEAGSLLLPKVNVVQGAHVTLLQYWYGAGLLGAIGFLALFVMPAKRMLQVLRKKLPEDSKNAVRLILASYASFFMIFSLGPYLYNRYLYIPMFVFAGFVARMLGPAEVLSVPRRHLLSTKAAPNLQPS